MSYTFEVHASRDSAPDSEALAARTTALVRNFLVDFPVERMVALSPALLDEAREGLAAGAAGVSVTVAGALRAPGDRAFLSVSDSEGRATIERIHLPETPAHASPDAQEGVRSVGYRVTRTIGQPALVALAHGMVAAALAELLDGIVWAPDGAWDPAHFPCRGDELAARFLRPGAAVAERYRRAAEDRLRALPGELTLFRPELVDRILDEVVADLIAEINGVRGDLDAELAAFDRAIDRLETVRGLSPHHEPDVERAVLIGDAAFGLRKGRASALARLHPNPAEYARWMGHLGEVLAW